MKAVYPAVFKSLHEGGYAARVPDVSGCVTTGRDLVETMDNVRDALAACICTLEDYGQPIPEPTAPERIEREPGAEVAFIDVDTLKYREETDTRCVRKNVSMPAWLCRMADRAGINCSAVLQDALMRRLRLR